MSSIILELQKEALDNNVSISQLLRKALVVAKKLNVEEFIDWISYELNGYDDLEKLPKYRKVGGQVMVHNPYHGWQPVIFGSKEESELMSSKNIFSPISEIENLCENQSDNSVISYSLPDGMTKSLMKSTLGMVPYFIINESQFHSIIDSVKNIVLNWSLKLEDEGIVGENLTFTEDDKQKASAPVYNIQNFTGVIGDVSESNLQIGDYNSIHTSLKKLGVSQEERNELEEIMDNYPKADSEEKKSLFKRGMDWLKRNGQTIGILSETIRKWFEIAT
ncbi:MAG: hypothetical protein WAV89_02925 [Ignavibacteriaceae bacterium]